MRILLIDPQFIESQDTRARYLAGAIPPNGLLSIAAVLLREGYDVQILDCQFHTFDSAYRMIDRLSPDVVGMTSTAATFEDALRLSTYAKERNAVVVLGGPHVSGSPDVCTQHSCLDYVVRGEGEETFKQLCHALRSGGKVPTIPGLTLVRKGECIQVGGRGIQEDLDALPMPAWSLLPLDAYFNPSVSRRKMRESISLVTSRGCPWSCTFCHNTSHKAPYRTRSPELMLEEVMHLYYIHGKRDFKFFDEVFTFPRTRAREFSESLLKEGLDILWACETRADLLDEETLRLMKRSGCHSIGFGVESANDVIRSRLNKGIEYRTALDAAKLIREAGMQSRAYFMIGFPGESPSQVEETLRLAAEIPVDYPVINFFSPISGTSIYDEALNLGTIIAPSGTDEVARLRGLNYVPETLTESYLLNEYRKHYRRIFLRPQRLLQFAKNVRRGDDIRKGILTVMQLWKSRTPLS